MTQRQFINSFLQYNPNDSVELKLAHYLNIGLESEIMYRLKWLGLFDNVPIGLSKGTPAQILEHILKKKWGIVPEDKDMIVMYHKFGYELDGQKHQIDATMVVEGEDQTYTAMAKTVGLPVAMATIAILNGSINTPGVQIPISKEIYTPILHELESYGIAFKEKEVTYLGYNPLNL